jgi:glutamate 5-kinase
MKKSEQPKKPLLVVKIGTSTLTAGTKRISRGKLEDIARQIEILREKYSIVLVSSGAIATARQYVEVSNWNELVQSKQALSAIGQPRLMQMYSEVFNDFGLTIAQCLMTYRDFENEESRRNTLNTIDELLRHNFIPVINENDTTAVEELILGDNDKLSALVATLVNADALIIASDVDGIYDKNPHIHSDAKHITHIHDLKGLEQVVEERENGLGTGGMQSKLEAIQICFEQNVTVYLVNGGKGNFISACLDEEIPSTKFVKSD